MRDVRHPPRPSAQRLRLPRWNTERARGAPDSVRLHRARPQFRVPDDHFSRRRRDVLRCPDRRRRLRPLPRGAAGVRRRGHRGVARAASGAAGACGVPDRAVAMDRAHARALFSRARGRRDSARNARRLGVADGGDRRRDDAARGRATRGRAARRRRAHGGRAGRDRPRQGRASSGPHGRTRPRARPSSAVRPDRLPRPAADAVAKRRRGVHGPRPLRAAGSARAARALSRAARRLSVGGAGNLQPDAVGGLGSGAAGARAADRRARRARQRAPARDGCWRTTSGATMRASSIASRRWSRRRTRPASRPRRSARAGLPQPSPAAMADRTLALYDAALAGARSPAPRTRPPSRSRPRAIRDALGYVPWVVPPPVRWSAVAGAGADGAGCAGARGGRARGTLRIRRGHGEDRLATGADAARARPAPADAPARSSKR